MSIARIFATILGVMKKFSYFLTFCPQITQIFTDFYFSIFKVTQMPRIFTDYK